MMFNQIYKTAYYTMCSQYAYSLYKDRTIYDTTYQTTHHTMYNPIYKTGYYTMCSQYAGWPPLTPAISSVCHSAVTPSPLHSFSVGTPIV